MIKAYTILMFGILLGLSLASWIELLWKQFSLVSPRN